MQSLRSVYLLDLASFTRRMEAKRENILGIRTLKYVVPPNIFKHILRSISNLPNGGAAGQSMMYSEMFSNSADNLAQFLVALWKTGGRLNPVLRERNKGRSVPLLISGSVCSGKYACLIHAS